MMSICIFSHLQNNLGKNPGKITYDPMYELKDKNLFYVVGKDLDEWKEFYPNAQETFLKEYSGGP